MLSRTEGEMSRSNLYFVYKTTVREVAEFRNSHGSAPPLWQWLCAKYLGWPENEYIFSRDLKPMWALGINPEVPEWARICLYMTFDAGVVTAEHQERAATACEECDKVIRAWPRWIGCVNHWAAIGAAIREANIPKRAIGIGLSCTSICDPWCGSERKFGEEFDCVGTALKVSA